MINAPPPVEPPKFDSVSEFFAQALAIEVEAAERYTLLADQMEVHNNKEIAAIFRKMASIEAEHRDEIARRAGDALVAGRPATFSWTGPDGPEATDFQRLHYLMTPRQALGLARFNEERAKTYYEAIAEAATDPAIAAFAREMAVDERDHVAWVDQWLAKFAADDPGWNKDPDPPVNSE
jgi:rubrerythrin